MPRSNVPPRLRVSSHIWPRVAVLTLVGLAGASCSNSARFDSNPYASNHQSAPPQQETTGSVSSSRPMYRNIEAQPLPAPSRPATVSANSSGYTSGTGSSSGAQGLGAYRPGNSNYSQGTSDVTGSVIPPSPKSSGAWTWDGGAPVTVGYGDTVEQIARKYGVPASAILQTNGINDASMVKPGQRLVIPRYVSSSAPAPQAPVAQARAQVQPSETVHVVGHGESLIGIARQHGVTLIALAKANNVEPNAKVAVGDRLMVPGSHAAAPRPVQYTSAAPQVSQVRTIPIDNVASVPSQNARVATTQAPEKTENVVAAAEPAGGVPSFRWPVKGRVIAGFGPKTGGAQNDGINLAVPEGTPIKAADDGVVAYAGNELKGYGNLVLIRHANGFVSAYAHASELMVKRGDSIKRGQVIAHAGQTGNVTSPQLHFEIRKGSTPVDPAQYLGGA
jgi:murein DD-endopeptidase MepM/ murein hydrolase activator NlpD